VPNEPLANLAGLSTSAEAGCSLIDRADQKAGFLCAEECKISKKPMILERMAGAEGFELSTCGFGDRRSNQLS